jgi:Domain of unknown function (DUF4148)
MNTPRSLIASSLVTVAALFATSGATAQEATPTGFDQTVSVASRADVHAQAVAALRAGLIESGEASRSTFELQSTQTRAQVLAEAVEARRLGLLGHGELSAPSATPAQAEQIRSAGLRALSVPMAQASR